MTHHTSDPFVRIVIPGVTCEFCPSLTDLDLFRAFDADDNDWKCPSCKEKFDNFDLEMKIIEWINVHLAAVKTQSVVCTSAKTLRVDYLSTVSEFGGKFVVRKDANSVRNFAFEAGNGFGNLLRLADSTRMVHLKVRE